MKVLIADSSVLIDLERGALIELAFSLPCTFRVSEPMFEQELAGAIGEHMLRLGLEVVEIDELLTARTVELQRKYRGLSYLDCTALALAESTSDILLAGDQLLRDAAQEENVRRHGLLWLTDQVYEHDESVGPDLAGRLETVAAHERARLPKRELHARLRKYRRL